MNLALGHLESILAKTEWSLRGAVQQVGNVPHVTRQRKTVRSAVRSLASRAREEIVLYLLGPFACGQRVDNRSPDSGNHRQSKHVSRPRGDPLAFDDSRH